MKIEIFCFHSLIFFLSFPLFLLFLSPPFYSSLMLALCSSIILTTLNTRAYLQTRCSKLLTLQIKQSAGKFTSQNPGWTACTPRHADYVVVQYVNSKVCNGARRVFNGASGANECFSFLFCILIIFQLFGAPLWHRFRPYSHVHSLFR